MRAGRGIYGAAIAILAALFMVLSPSTGRAQVPVNNQLIASGSPYRLVNPMTYYCNASAGLVIANLPNATGSGVVYQIYKTDATAASVGTATTGNCAAAPNQSDVIDGVVGTSYLGTQFQSLLLTDRSLGHWAIQIGAGNSAGTGSGTLTNFTASNGLTVTNPTTTPNLLIPNNTQYAAGFSGATADVKIAACLAAIPSTGGTCDATGLTGVQSLAATVAVPAKATLLLGGASYTSAVLPSITMAPRSQLICQGATQLSSTGVTVITGPGGAGAVIQSSTSPASAGGFTVENCVIQGVSNADSSIGIDLIGVLEATIEHNILGHLQTGMRIGGNGACACYNMFAYNFFGATLGIGEDYQQTANKNISIADSVQASVTYGFHFAVNAVGNLLLAPDIESFGNSAGIAIDFEGSANEVRDPYIEAGHTGVQFESTAVQDRVEGAGIMSSLTTSVNYTTSLQQMNYVQLQAGGGIGAILNEMLWPQYTGAFNYFIGSGSSNVYYTIDADALGSGLDWIGTLFTPAQQAETAFGLTGHAGMRVGQLRTTGGIGDTGEITTTQITTPATPVCTATCEPSTTCATTFTYAVEGVDFSGGQTTKSASATCTNASTLTTAAAQNAACASAGSPLTCCTGSGTGTCIGNFNSLAWTKQDGLNKWNIIGDLDLTHDVQLNQSVPIPAASSNVAGTTYLYKDDGSHVPAGYTPNTRNSTADTQSVGLAQFKLGVGSTPQTLATFGTCNSVLEGLHATQTNSTAACSAGATATSSGTTHCSIYCNGSNWLQEGF